MTTDTTAPRNRPWPEKDFALREASRRADLLSRALAEANDAPDVERKLEVSRLALKEVWELTAVLGRVITVLERCQDGDS